MLHLQTWESPWNESMLKLRKTTRPQDCSGGRQKRTWTPEHVDPWNIGGNDSETSPTAVDQQTPTIHTLNRLALGRPRAWFQGFIDSKRKSQYERIKIQLNRRTHEIRRGRSSKKDFGERHTTGNKTSLEKLNVWPRSDYCWLTVWNRTLEAQIGHSLRVPSFGSMTSTLTEQWSHTFFPHSSHVYNSFESLAQ